MTTSPEALREATSRLTEFEDLSVETGAGYALLHVYGPEEDGPPAVFGLSADLKTALSALQEAREAEGHYVCGFQQANMEARMIVAEILGDTAENAAIQAELVATADRRALSLGGADE